MLVLNVVVPLEGQEYSAEVLVILVQSKFFWLRYMPLTSHFSSLVGVEAREHAPMYMRLPVGQVQILLSNAQKTGLSVTWIKEQYTGQFVSVVVSIPATHK
jgi:hypothetical protein